MAEIRGRVFGPGFDAAGEPARARWVGARLSVAAGERVVDAAAVEVRATGFNATHLEVAWQEGGERFALLIDEAASRAAFQAGAPAAVARGAAAGARHGRRVERRFRLGWGVIGLIAALPLLALVWAAVNADAAAGWVVDRIPVAQEARLGDLVLAQTRAQMTLRDSGPAVDAVKAIGEKLTAGTAHRYRWFVAEAKDLNAFAAPGGVVVVFSGLIQAAETPEEVAGVLAHEVAHAELRHGVRAMVKNLGLQAALAIVVGDAGGVLGDAAAKLTELKFSRDAEREADADGLRRLRAAGIDPAGMVRFFEKLDAQAKLAPPAFLSTHPDSGDRAAALAAMLKASPPRAATPLAIDWPAVQRSLPPAR